METNLTHYFKWLCVCMCVGVCVGGNLAVNHWVQIPAVSLSHTHTQTHALLHIHTCIAMLCMALDVYYQTLVKPRPFALWHFPVIGATSL